MIDRCFVHCSGVGPRTAERLNTLGFSSWGDCLQNPEKLPFRKGRRDNFLSSLMESREALDKSDLAYLIARYPVKEHWRILGTYFPKATFFDIETTGISWYHNHPTVIAAYHKGELMNFIHGENLDDFLSLLDDTELLVSFNGSSFDIPFLERYFNLPGIETPHIDLRWVAYHQGYKGGLKKIEKDLGIVRPREIKEVDGYEAVLLYTRWMEGDPGAGKRLMAYCRSDVISSYLSAAIILERAGIKTARADMSSMFARAMDFEM